MPLLEEFIRDLNARHFLKEFSFPNTTFKRDAVGTLEVADHVIWIEDLLFLFQLKDRQGPTSTLSDWIARTVLKKGSKQIRDTLSIAESTSPVNIVNSRGHTFDFRNARGAHAYKIVVFQIPREQIQAPGPRYHVSTTAGFIHIFNWVDYQQLLNSLVTPIEIADFLGWRESVLNGRPHEGIPSEGALIGQYLLDELTEEPAERFAGALLSIIEHASPFRLSQFLDAMPEHIVGVSTTGNDYYRLLGQIAKLSRLEVEHFADRLLLSLEVARQDQFEQPYRFVAPRIDCGFLIVPLTRNVRERRLVGLQNLTAAAKYDQRTSRQVGISIVFEGSAILIDWAFLEHPWRRNPVLEDALTTMNPFRPLRTAQQARYHFNTNQLRRLGLD